ncbi:MAG: acetyl-CoA C-acetyltransferase [Turicibacter sp.]|nr:acetyl-CoA C-acetyltransferase [Turicibacter sp.]
MSNVYICAAKRSAIGNFLGTLKDVHPAEIGAAVVKDILTSTKLDATALDEVIVGNVLSAGVGQGIARQVALKGGVDESIPAYAINQVCCSGMKAVMNAATAITAGQADLILAGGVESMSGTPFLLPGGVRSGNKLGNFNAVDHMVYDALTDAFEQYHMGITAENIVEQLKISREEQDEYAITSQTKAIAAQDAGRFANEIVPLTVRAGRTEITFDTDEYINRSTNLEKLAKLRPAFKKDGTVTAGNASGINDGASFTLVASEAAVKKHNLTPLVEIVAYAQAGLDHKIMGLGPVHSTKKALSQANLAISDIDLIEFNEAFAAQSLGVLKSLSADLSISQETLQQKVNPNGGAIALGHPVGASGNRIIVTLIHEMQKSKATLGLASLCAGGGMGCTVIFKRI